MNFILHFYLYLIFHLKESINILLIFFFSNNLMLKVLFQILIFTLFIFSNGYQSLVTSFMLNPLEVKLLKNFDDLLDSNLNFEYDNDINTIYWENPKYQKMVYGGRLRSIDSKIKAKRSDNLAFTQPCREFDFTISLTRNKKFYGELYRLSGTAYSHMSRLFVGILNPFIEKFQNLADLTFEAGLQKAWKVFHEVNLSNTKNILRIKEIIEKNEKIDERIFLDFDAIIPMFVILGIGLGISLLSLLFEIFYYDFLKRLTIVLLKRDLQKLWFKCKKLKFRP